jgi:hypothetical protein
VLYGGDVRTQPLPYSCFFVSFVALPLLRITAAQLLPFHLDRIADALAQPTCSDCFSVSAKLMTAGGLSFRVSNYGSGVIL